MKISNYKKFILRLLIGCITCLSKCGCASQNNNMSDQLYSFYDAPIKTYSKKGGCEERSGKYNPASIEKIGAFIFLDTEEEEKIIVPYIINKLGNKQFIEFDVEKKVFYATCLEYQRKKEENYLKDIDNKKNNFYVSKEKIQIPTETKKNAISKYEINAISKYEIYETTSHDVPMKNLFRPVLAELTSNESNKEDLKNIPKKEEQTSSNKSHELPYYIKNLFKDEKDLLSKCNCIKLSNKENCQLELTKETISCKGEEIDLKHISILIDGFDPLPLNDSKLEEKKFRFYVKTPDKYKVGGEEIETTLELSLPINIIETKESSINNTSLIKLEGETNNSLCIAKPTIKDIVNSQLGQKERKLNDILPCDDQTTPKVNQEQHSGPYKLVVISLSDGLGEIGTSIQADLIKFLKEFKEPTFFDLFIIKNGQKIEEVPVPRDTNKIKKSIVFGSDDINAMYNLTLLDDTIRKRDSDDSKRIGKILYITDNSMLEYTPKNIPSAQLGILRVWNDVYNIKLHVLTTGCNPVIKKPACASKKEDEVCNSWREGAKATCEQIKKGSNIFDKINSFISKSD